MFDAHTAARHERLTNPRKLARSNNLIAWAFGVTFTAMIISQFI